MVKWIRHFGCFLFTAVCLSVLVFGGCSEKSGEGDSKESVFRYPLVTKVKSLDTGNIEDVYGSLVCSQICESPYTYAYLKRPFVLEPLLAEAMPEISDDKLTYTIRIKQGVYFQDDPCFSEGKGRPLKAQDFVFAFKRIANIRYASPNWGGFKERIAGLDEFRDYTNQFKNEFEVDYSRDVEGLKSLDDYTLQIKLAKPWPQFIDDLTSVVTAPVAKEAVD
jgi:oligopeptide transport system substrate-binding protein